MRPHWLAVLFILLTSVHCTLPEDPELKTEEDRTLYALGIMISDGLQRSKAEFTEEELRLITLGVEDALQGKNYRVILDTYRPKVEDLVRSRIQVGQSQHLEKNEKDRKEYEAKMAKIKKDNEDYLAASRKDPNLKEFPSGLIFGAIKEGTGDSPSTEDKVTTHYHGTFPDGTVFDSSVQKGTPATFPVTGVIPCWVEALQMMKVGGKYKVVCPSEIGYNDGYVRIFEVDLLDIKK